MAAARAYVPGEIPNGITFGNKVLELPPTAEIFRFYGMSGPTRLLEPFTWVQRGTPVAVFHYHWPKVPLPFLNLFLGEVEHQHFILCPASGFLLNRLHDTGPAHPAEPSYPTSLLLADDEPPAQNGAYMAEALHRFCRTNLHNLYRSRYSGYRRTKGEVSEQELETLLDSQLSRTCRYVDAMPKYNEYFEAARTRFPHLRPHLKHLL